MITVACVLKSGGVYTTEYVVNLKANLAKHLRIKHRFVCLTDEELPNDIHTRQLRHQLPGWWSKMELFSCFAGPTLYFDLDTVIVGDITPLARAVRSLGRKMLMLRGFKRRRWASGIMGWNGNYDWILAKFLSVLPQGVFNNDGKQLRINNRLYWGDQYWLTMHLGYKRISRIAVQDVLGGVYSYKRNKISQLGLPGDTRIVCFHGRPRLHEIDAGCEIARLWKGEGNDD